MLMLKNKAAKRGLTVAVALVTTLGLAGQGFPHTANAAEILAEGRSSNSGFTYQSENVILNSSNVHCYEIDLTKPNKMGATITEFSGGPHGGGPELSRLTNGVEGHADGVKLGTDENKKVGWIVIDAGAQYPVHSVLVDLVHNWGSDDLVIQLSTTEDFASPVTVFNNDIDNTLNCGNVNTADFFADFAESVTSGRLLNAPNDWTGKARVWNFAPVTAQYIRITGNMVGNGQRQGYTCFSEIQMFGYTTEGATGHAAVSPVTFSSAGGTFETAQKVTLSAAEGAEIYYTTDGSVPTEASEKYTGAIDTAELSNACLIRAVAKVNGVMGLPTQGTFAHGFVGNPNVALNQSVKFYRVDPTAANKMGVELTGSIKRGDATEQTGKFKDGQAFSQAVDGNFGGGSLSIMNADWQVKIPGNPQSTENIYGTGVTTESGGGENLWEMKEYFWTVVDFGEAKDIGSVQVSFIGDARGVCVQLSTSENFSENVTTVYCDAENLAAVTAGANVGASWAGNNQELRLASAVNARYIRATGWAVSDARYWTHKVPANGASEDINTNTFHPISSDYETLANGEVKEHFVGTNLAEVAAMKVVPVESPNVAQNGSVKFYRVDKSADNRMGAELTGSIKRGSATEQTGKFKDGQSFSDVIDGNFGGNPLSIMDANLQTKIPGTPGSTENIYGTGVTTESGAGENLWEMKEYFWTVVDFGAIKDITSVRIAFYNGHAIKGACVQLSQDKDFATGVTTVYCNDSAIAACVGAADGEAWRTDNEEHQTITLNEAVSARYIRVTGWSVDEGRYWTHKVPANGASEDINTNTFRPLTNDYVTNADGTVTEHFIGTNMAEVAAMIAPAIEAAPAVKPYLTEMKDAYGESFGKIEVPNKSTAESVAAQLGSTVSFVDSASQKYMDVAGTWSCANYNGATAGNYTFTFVPENAANLPVDAYGVMTAQVSVLAAPDFTALNAAISAAQAKTQTDYTATSWAAMQEKLTAANTVKDGAVTQAQVDTAASELNAAVTALAQRGNTSALQSAYNANKDKQEPVYLSSTWNKFEKALTEAKTLLDNSADASQADIDAKKTALENAAAALVTRANTGDLKAEYDKQKAAFGVADNNDKYTKAAWSAYLTAMDNAKEILDNNDVEQKAADEKLAAIKSAVENLKEVASADSKTALQTKIDGYDGKESSYVAASWTQFKPALDAAKQALAANPAYKTDIDKAAADLDAAIAKLVALGDPAALKTLIATEVEEESVYTAESWAAYQKALADAKTAADGKHAQSDIDAAKTALDNAIKGLEKAKTGCCSSLNAIPLAAMGVIALAGVAIVLTKKKEN